VSTTAVGVLLNLDGPLPVKRQYSLIDFPGVLKEEVGENDGEPRWMNGVNVWGYPGGVPDVWEPCATGTERVKASGRGDELPRWDPFTVYFDLTCSMSFVGNGTNWEEFENRAELAMDATLSYGVEKALSQGVPFGSNPFFGDGNGTILNGGVAVRPQEGFGLLENAIANQTGRQGMIHADPGTIAASGIQGAGFLPEIHDLYTPAGTPLISGAGYVGAFPTGYLETDPGASLSWIFATGPVEVRLGAGPTIDISQTLVRSDNEVTFRAERYVLAHWDTDFQAAVLVDWSMTG
jgi:hypothetical protein